MVGTLLLKKLLIIYIHSCINLPVMNNMRVGAGPVRTKVGAASLSGSCLKVPALFPQY
jgi:hypothetical protein